MSDFWKTKNQGLDVLRALAILLVVYLHFHSMPSRLPEWISNTSKIGWIGVDLFFVLSGFLIGAQVFRETDKGVWTPMRNFWIRRWFRTLPLYFLVLAFYALVKPLFGFRFVDGHWGFLVFAQNYMKLNDFVQSWSLCVEEQFYLFFPILAFGLGLRYRSKWIWLLPLLASMIGRTFLYRSGVIDTLNPMTIDYRMRFVTHYHLDGISMGVFLAATFDSWIRWPKRYVRPLGVIGAVLAFVTPFVSQYHLAGLWSVFGFPVISLGFSLMVISFYTLEFPKTFMIPVSKIALWSYGIYLWNIVMVRIVFKMHWIEGSWVAQALALVGGSILLSAFTYYTVEKRFMKWRVHFLQTSSLR